MCIRDRSTPPPGRHTYQPTPHASVDRTNGPCVFERSCGELIQDLRRGKGHRPLRADKATAEKDASPSRPMHIKMGRGRHHQMWSRTLPTSFGNLCEWPTREGQPPLQARPRLGLQRSARKLKCLLGLESLRAGKVLYLLSEFFEVLLFPGFWLKG